MQEFIKSKEYIKDFITSLVSTKVYEGTANGYLYSFKLQPQNIEIVFNRHQLDDLGQYLINENINSDQFKAFWGDLKFHILIILGKAGLIPSFDIVNELLNEKREWVQGGRFNFQAEKWLCDLIYHGLIKFKQFLDEIIENNDDSPIINEFVDESSYVGVLITHYNNHNGLFNHSSISERPLSYFKAAAVIKLRDLENDRKNIKIAKLLKNKDEEIYKIVEVFRQSPFPQIKMPESVFDFFNQNQSPIKENDGGKPIVFISYEAQEFELADFVRDVLLRTLGDKLKPFVAKRDIKKGAHPYNVMLEDNLKKAQAIISICSQKSKFSSWVIWETASVWARDNKIFPLFTNISGKDYGPPLIQVSQGAEYFIKEEFIQTIADLCDYLKIVLGKFDLTSEEIATYKTLHDKYRLNFAISNPIKNSLKILNNDFKHYYQKLFTSQVPYFNSDALGFLSNYKNFNTSNKSALWSQLLTDSNFSKNHDILDRMNNIIQKIEELNSMVQPLIPERFSIGEKHISVRNCYNLMQEIRNCYGEPNGDLTSYEDSTVGAFLIKESTEA